MVVRGPVKVQLELGRFAGPALVAPALTAAAAAAAADGLLLVTSRRPAKRISWNRPGRLFSLYIFVSGKQGK